MTAQWVKYDGSDEQIAEMENAVSFIIKANGVESHVMHHIDERGLLVDCDEYLICNRHKDAKLIQRWSITGQPVWVRPKKPYEFKISDYENHPTTKLMVDNKGVYFITTTPDWNMKADFSFTPFEDEV